MAQDVSRHKNHGGFTLLVAGALIANSGRLAPCQCTMLLAPVTQPFMAAPSEQMPAYEVATIKPAEANGRALKDKRAKGNCLGHAIVEGTLAASHFGTLLQQLLDLGMNVKVRRIARQCVRDLRNLIGRDSCFNFIFRQETPAFVVVPIRRQLRQPWSFLQLSRMLLCVADFRGNGLHAFAIVDADLFRINLM